MDGNFKPKNLRASLKFVPVHIPTYDGEYVVTPSVDSQSLETAGKKLMYDILVNPIPYSEEPNSSGGITVKIG